MTLTQTTTTLKQALVEARAALKTQKVLVAELSAKAKAERAATKQAKLSAALAKAEARLAKLPGGCALNPCAYPGRSSVDGRPNR